MLFNSRTIASVALATLIGSADLVNAFSGTGSSRMQLKARHNSLHARQGATVQKRSEEVVPVIEEKIVKIKKRDSKKCPAKGSKPPPANVEMAPTPSSMSRLDKIRNMYAFAGFVYAIDACQSSGTMNKDFSNMVNKYKARNVITFGHCQSKGFYGQIISAAKSSNINLILLADTLPNGGYDDGAVSSTISTIVKAIIANPDPVLALAIGDEPFFDSDLGGVGGIVGKINYAKSQFKAAGLDVPVSVSDMAYGWQSAGQTSASSQGAKAVDFFMANVFPYFSSSATTGGSQGAWNSFKKDIEFFESIAGGKPIMVTQTGWPSTREEFAPNSNSITVSKSSAGQYWHLLDNHCSDFFKAKNIPWMYRSFNDQIAGWGLLDGSGTPKFDVSHTKTTC